MVVVNTAFRLAPWADALFGGDARWWAVYGREVDQIFQGERWTGAEHVDGTNWIQVVDEPGLSISDRRIHFGGHAGYQTLNLVYSWGVVRIILLAYDLCRGPKQESHFHGNHEGGLPNLGDLKDWVRRMTQLGIELRDRGIEVVNASRQTALTIFERLPIGKALYPVRPAHVARGFNAALEVRQELLPREYMALDAGLIAAGYQHNVGRPDLTVMWGTHKAEVDDRVIVAENGYLNGNGGPYVALALGGHNGAGKWPHGGPERWNRLGIELKPWREDGKHILLLPSRGISSQPMPKDWVQKTVAYLKHRTQREIRVRQHPGNWKPRAAEIDRSLADDLKDAWACVTWASTAGLKALIAGIPVIYTAPHWIGAEASSPSLHRIEDPLMCDRLPMFQRLAWAQWTLDEITTGQPVQTLASLSDLTVMCVLKSGGDYTAEYVRRLRDGVSRHLAFPHRFVCLSDVPVPCERIPLKHGWKGWWSKMELFRPDVITGRTLYLDLDTVIVGDMTEVASIPYDFAMLNIREKDNHIGNSGAMWFGKAFPDVYERFAAKPDHWIDFHERNAHDRYMGDQAFISDCFENIPKLHQAVPGMFRSYKYDNCQHEIPHGCSIVCFGGKPRPHEAGGWVKQAWV